jgi:hypothetical protein
MGDRIPVVESRKSRKSRKSNSDKIVDNRSKKLKAEVQLALAEDGAARAQGALSTISERLSQRDREFALQAAELAAVKEELAETQEELRLVRNDLWLATGAPKSRSPSPSPLPAPADIAPPPYRAPSELPQAPARKPVSSRLEFPSQQEQHRRLTDAGTRAAPPARRHDTFSTVARPAGGRPLVLAGELSRFTPSPPTSLRRPGPDRGS